MLRWGSRTRLLNCPRTVRTDGGTVPPALRTDIGRVVGKLGHHRHGSRTGPAIIPLALKSHINVGPYGPAVNVDRAWQG